MYEITKDDDSPPLRGFNVSNHLLGDPKALEAAWERDGYWFFRDVLDKQAVARLRGVYLKVLNDLGLVDSSREDAAVYNGATLDNYPIYMGGPQEIDPLMAIYPRDQFVNEPSVKAFFTELLGDEPFWVPNTEYHAVPPRPSHSGGGSDSSERLRGLTPVAQKNHNSSRFNFIHSDRANNKGLPLKVFWIPVAPIDEATGGLAVAEGMHRPRMNDFPRSRGGIAYGAVPDDAWRRAEMQPGDLLAFSLETPHSGLANRSDQYFRLSMDIRAMKKSENIPTVGKVSAIDGYAIAVTTEDGEERIFRIDEDTYCRVSRGRLSGMPLELEEIPKLVNVGDPVYVASDHGTATFIRPQH